MTRSRITFMGAVPPWECDAVDHLTVGYYFQKLDYATAAALHACGIEPTEPAAATMTRCQVRFDAELRKGDIYRIHTMPLGRDVLGHVVVNAETDAVCTRFHQSLSRRVPDLPLPDGEAAPGQVDWDWARLGTSAEDSPAPRLHWLDTGRDIVTDADRGPSGGLGSHACILRFSAAGEHLRNAIGMTPSYARERNVGFATFAFDFRPSGGAFPGTPLATQSCVAHVGRTSLAIEHRLRSLDTGAEIARLSQRGVHLDKARRRPAPFPERIVENARRLLPGADGAIR